jgi:Rrf2 family nitric oxide-sensitive transcriptional repressor
VQLANSTDLALRVILRLARTDDTAPLTCAEVATAVGGPYSQVAEAVGSLQQLGVVAGWGPDSDLTLTPHGHGASVGRLVRELEGTGEVAGCEGDPPCPLSDGCRLRGALRAAQEAFFAALDPITVQDLVAGKRQWLDLSAPMAR